MNAWPAVGEVVRLTDNLSPGMRLTDYGTDGLDPGDLGIVVSHSHSNRFVEVHVFGKVSSIENATYLLFLNEVDLASRWSYLVTWIRGWLR